MARKQANGRKRALPVDSSDLNSAAKPAPQPAELSERDRLALKSWLDTNDKPFTIQVAPASKSLKRKRDADMQLQTDLFEDRLNLKYQVRPRDKWECLRRYKKFTVGSESIAAGQCILVKHDESDDAKIDVAAQWKAKVLEVRALDSEHVYIRLAWLNRPEDLDGGRQPYHGRNELIPTNEMDIIDAMTVNGSLKVEHWNEEDDDGAPMDDDIYFWRQTFDSATTRKFSKIRNICVDKKPQNPDEMILQCGNPDCRKWMHVRCIAETAVHQAAASAAGDANESVATKPRPKNEDIPAKSLVSSKGENEGFTAEVLIKKLPDGEGQTPAAETEIVITTPDGESYSAPVSCLLCGKEVE